MEFLVIHFSTYFWHQKTDWLLVADFYRFALCFFFKSHKICKTGKIGQVMPDQNSKMVINRWSISLFAQVSGKQVGDVGKNTPE